MAYEFPPMYSIPAGAFLVLSFNPDGHAIKYSVNASAYSCSRHNQFDNQFDLFHFLISMWRLRRYIGYGLKKASTVSFVFKPTKTTIASFTYKYDIIDAFGSSCSHATCNAVLSLVPLTPGRLRPSPKGTLWFQ